MSDESYFVKIRGRVLGPFAPERLVQMAGQGQLSRVHMISIDGNHWQRASEFPQFFVESIEPGAKTESTTSTTNVDRLLPAVDIGPNASQPSSVEGLWHYAINEESIGPVTKSAIVKLISIYQLKATDKVWRQGMEDWARLGDVAEFSLYVGNVPQVKVNEHKKDLKSETKAKSDLIRTTRIVRWQSVPVLIACILMYLSAFALFFVFLFGLFQLSQQVSNLQIAKTVIAIAQMAVVFVAAFCLNRYLSFSSRFALSKNVEDLNASLDMLSRFWMMLIAVLVVWLASSLVLLGFSALDGFDSQPDSQSKPELLAPETEIPAVPEGPEELKQDPTL